MSDAADRCTDSLLLTCTVAITMLSTHRVPVDDTRLRQVIAPANGA